MLIKTNILLMKSLFNTASFTMALISFIGLFSSCSVLRPTGVTIKHDIRAYSRVFIPSTNTIQSRTDSKEGNTITTESQSVNPRDLIAGTLAKQGYIILHQLDNRFLNDTMIITYGESGRRSIITNNVTEITLQLVSASTGELLGTITAEGLEDNEAETIRVALTRALQALPKR